VKRTVLCFAVLCLALTLFTVNAAAEDVTEITIWHMEEPQSRIDAFQDKIDEFNEAHPDIHVEQQIQDWMEAYTQVMAAAQADQEPEILFAIPDFTVAIKQAGLVEPVDDLVEMLDDKHGFLEEALRPYQFDDHTWAIPNFGMVHVMWYRKDLFEEVGLDPEEFPETWDELREVVEAFEDHHADGIGLPASDHLFTDQAIYSIMSTVGADVFDEEGELVFNSPETVKAYEFYNELVAASPPDSVNWGWAEPQLALNTGMVAITMEKGQFLAPFEEESGLDGEYLGGAPVPQPEEDGQRASIYYPNAKMVLTDDENKLEAIEKFLLFLYEPETKGEWLAEMDPGLFLPVTETARDSESYWEHPVIAQYSHHVEMMWEQSEYGKLFGFNHDVINPAIGEIAGRNILAEVVQEMVVRERSPEEAVEWGEQQMLEILEEAGD